jgi:hypothetical protein
METFAHDSCIASYWYGRRNNLHQITQHTYTGMRKNASLKGKRKRTLSHATDHSRGQKKNPHPKLWRAGSKEEGGSGGSRSHQGWGVGRSPTTRWRASSGSPHCNLHRQRHSIAYPRHYYRPRPRRTGRREKRIYESRQQREGEKRRKAKKGQVAPVPSHVLMPGRVRGWSMYCSIYRNIAYTVFMQWWLQCKSNSMKFFINGVRSFWVNFKVWIFELLWSVKHWAQFTIFRNLMEWN